MSQLLTLCLLLLTCQGGEEGCEGRIKPRNTEIHLATLICILILGRNKFSAKLLLLLWAYVQQRAVVTVEVTEA